MNSSEQRRELITRRRETELELRRLEKRWPELRRDMSAGALVAVWILFGDTMWHEPEQGGQKQWAILGAI